MLYGIPTFEVHIGDYLEDWEIAEKWADVDGAMKAARLDGIKFVEERRDEKGRFRSYTLVADDITKGRL